jgi:hypothetical protein
VLVELCHVIAAVGLFMDSSHQGDTVTIFGRLFRLNFVYIFSVSTAGLCVYRSFVFDKLTWLFVVDVGRNVRDKFARFFIVDVGSNVRLLLSWMNVL